MSKPLESDYFENSKTVNPIRSGKPDKGVDFMRPIWRCKAHAPEQLINLNPKGEKT